MAPARYFHRKLVCQVDENNERAHGEGNEWQEGAGDQADTIDNIRQRQQCELRLGGNVLPPQCMNLQHHDGHDASRNDACEGFKPLFIKKCLKYDRGGWFAQRGNVVLCFEAVPRYKKHLTSAGI